MEKNKRVKYTPNIILIIVLLAITLISGATFAFFHYKASKDVNISVGYTKVEDDITFSVNGEEIISGAIMNQPLINSAHFSLTEGSRSVLLRVAVDYESTSFTPTTEQLITVTALNTDYIKEKQTTVTVENEYYWQYYEGYYYLMDNNPNSETYQGMLAINDSADKYYIFNENTKLLFPNLVDLFRHFGITHEADNDELKLYLDTQAIQSEYLPSYEFEDLVEIFDMLHEKREQLGYLVSFNTLGGSDVLSQIVANNSVASLPTEIPTNEGYDFAGWYTSEDKGVTLSENPYDFNTPVTDNMVIYAKWDYHEYTLNFNPGDLEFAEVIQPIKFTFDNGVGADKIPQKPLATDNQYNFLYWVDTEGNVTTEIQPGVKKDMTLIAVWDNVWNGKAGDGFFAGSGTEQDPYLIATPAQLAYLRDQVDARRKFTNEYIKLVNDIKLNNTDEWESWTSNTSGLNIFGNIGGEDIYTLFEGIFLGNNKTISGLYKSTLFNYIGYEGVVKDLILNEGANPSRSYAIAVNNYGTIENVTSYIENSSLVNYNYGTIKNCVNRATKISGASDVGGIANFNTATKDSFVLENYLTEAVIDSCINYASISSTSGVSNVGGITGTSSTNAKVLNCVNNGEISLTGGSTGYYRVGGIVGYQYYSPSSSGTVETVDGANVIYNCINNAKIYVTKQTYIGGIVGYMSSLVDVIKCINHGDVTAYSHAGGISGYSSFDTSINYIRNAKLYSNIDSCINNGNVKSLTNGYASGIVAYSNYYVLVSSCTNTGNIESNYYYTAGICAYNQYATIINCLNMGTITGRTNTAGITAYSVTTNSSYYGELGYTRNCVNLARMSNTYDKGIGENVTESYFVSTVVNQSGTNVYEVSKNQDEWVISSTRYGNFNKVVDLVNIYLLINYHNNEMLYWDYIEDDTLSFRLVENIPSRYGYHTISYPSGDDAYNTSTTKLLYHYIEGMVYDFPYSSNVIKRDGSIFQHWNTSSTFEDQTIFTGLKGNENADFNIYGDWINFMEDFGGGLGTEESPYLIDSREDLELLYILWRDNTKDADNGNYYYSQGKYYKQTANIEFNSEYLDEFDKWGTEIITDELFQWSPIGNKDRSFKANYDGGNYTISGIYINSISTSSYNGLFGYINGNTINDINLDKCYIQSGRYAAGIACYAYDTTFDNCSFDGKVITIFPEGNKDSSGHAAGIVGEVGSGINTFTNCVNKGDISGYIRVGGIVGRSSTSSSSTIMINDCKNTGNLLKNYNYTINYDYGVGGAIASVYYNPIIVIENFVNEGSITSVNSYTGGIIGYYRYDSNTAYPYKQVSVKNSINKGTITGTSYVAGGIGRIYYCSLNIDNVDNEGNIIGTSYGGGILGYVTNLSTEVENTITNCDNTEKITGQYYIGGIVGYISLYDTMTNCTNEGDILSTYESTSNYYIGGIAGKIYFYNGASIQNLTNRGKVTSSINIGAAGIVGQFESLSSNYTNTITISDINNYGEISSKYTTGGIIANTSYGLIKLEEVHNYANLQTDGNASLGGIVGNVSSYIELNNVSNSGVLVGSGNSGGILGYVNYSLTVTEVSNSGDVTGVNYAGGIIGVVNSSNSAIINIKDSNNSASIARIGTDTSYRYGAGGCIGCVYNVPEVNIDNFENTDAINNEKSSSGGITGCYGYTVSGTTRKLTITKSKNTAEITGNSYVGGLCGYVYDSDIIQSYNEGNITGSSYVGGLFGYYRRSSTQENLLTGLYNTGDINATGSYVGGLFGSCSYTNLKDCYTDCVIDGGSYVGAIAGSFNGTTDYRVTIEGVTYTSTPINAKSYSGALFGSVNYLDLSNYTNNFDVSGSEYVGGIVASASNSTFTNIVNNGEIVGDNKVGGIVSNSSNTTYNNTINNGDITVTGTANYQSYVGGIVGYTTTSISFEDCENNGDISGIFRIGGIIGRLEGKTTTSIIIKNSKNTGNLTNTSTSAQSSYDYGVGGAIGSIYVNPSVTIENFTNEGDIINIVSYTGGIIGFYRYDTSPDSNPYNQVSIKNSINKGDITGTSYVSGGIGRAQYCSLIIDNVDNEGVITCTSNYVGGIIGYIVSVKPEVDNTIINCDNIGNVDGAIYTGGIIGYISNCKITECTNTAKITGDYYVGGIVGYLSLYDTFTNCINEGEIFSDYATTSTGYYIGGVIGKVYFYNQSSIQNLTNKGQVVSSSYIGAAGIIGQLETSSSNYTNTLTIKDIHNYGEVNANYTVGGIVASSNYGLIKLQEVYNYANISTQGKYSSGGIIGEVSSDVELNKISNEGDVTGDASSGGICGTINRKLTCENLTNSGSVTGFNYAGGLIGYISTRSYSVNITISSNSGVVERIGTDASSQYGAGGCIGSIYYYLEVNIDGFENSGSVINEKSSAGGIIGRYGCTSGVNNILIIAKSKNTAEITGNSYVGGLCGYVYDGEITESYNEGNITGVSYVGGLFGYYRRSSAQENVLTGLYNTGDIKSTGSYVGGLFGECYYTNLKDCYTDCVIDGGSYVGAVAGSFNGTTDYRVAIEGFTYTSAPINTNTYVGSLFGSVNYLDLSDYTNEYDITGTNYVGGIVAIASNSTFTNIVNNGDIIVTGTANYQSYVGGIVGYTTTSISFEGCENNGDISGIFRIGGIIGRLEGKTTTSIIIKNSKNTGNLTNTSTLAQNSYDYGVGGAIGSTYVNPSVTIENFTNEGDIINIVSYTGGIIGFYRYDTSPDSYPYNQVSITNCINKGNITGTSYASGGIGRAQYCSLIIDNVDNEGVITGTDSYVGGIIGNSNNLSTESIEDNIINNCKNSGNIIGINGVGGIIGNNGASNISILNCENSATITGNYSLGGIAGSLVIKNSMSDCINTGEVYSEYSSSSGYYIGGVVGYLTSSSATLSNIINRADVINKITYTGGVFGIISGTSSIENIYNYGDVVTIYSAGGIIGRLNSTINAKEVHNYGAVTGASRVGGIIAFSEDSTNYVWNITNCSNNGILTNTGNSYGVGGLVAFITYAPEIYISNFINNGNIASAYGRAGGVIGYYGQYSNGKKILSVKNTINSANITGSNGYIGGIIGYVGYATLILEEVSNSGEINGTTQLGGLVGYTTSLVAGGYIKDSSNTGTITGTGSSVGGLVGYSSSNLPIENSYNNANVYGTSSVGGVVGYTYSNIINSYNLGNIKSTNQNVGGIVGVLYSANVSNCYNLGNVETSYTSSNCLGGIVGYTYGTCYISNSYNIGNISGKYYYIGGILGSWNNARPTIYNCFNKGSIITTYSDNNSLIGGISGNEAYIYNSANYGSVTNGSGISGTAYVVKNCINFGNVDKHGIGKLSTTSGVLVENAFYLNGTTGTGYYGIGTTEDSGSVVSFTKNGEMFALATAVSGKTNLLDVLNAFKTTNTEYTYLDWIYDEYYGYVVLDMEANNTININSLSEFEYFISMLNSGETFTGKLIKLNVDIDLNDLTDFANWGTTAPSNIWTPIGMSGVIFNGIFDGNSHAIKGMYIPSGNAVGLFAELGVDGVIKNLAIVNAHITGNASVGAIVAVNNGLIKNCYVRDSVINGTSTNVGGMVGLNNGSITNGYTSITITSGKGGIVGNNTGNVEFMYTNCIAIYTTNTGTVTNVSQYTVSELDSKKYFTLANKVYASDDMLRALNVWSYINNYEWYWNNDGVNIYISINLPSDYEVYTITYYVDGGIFETVPISRFINGGIYILPTNIFKEYYHFMGWYLDSDFTTQITEIGVNVAKNITVYGKWEEDEHTLTFILNGGQSDITSKKVYDTLAVGELPIPTRAGYEFMGWYENEDLSGNKWTENLVFKYKTDKNLYASWKVNQYTLTLIYGGEELNSIKTVTFDEKVGGLPTPTREGYTFEGWCDREDGTGMYYDSESIYQIAQSINLYAIWKVVE